MKEYTLNTRHITSLVLVVLALLVVVFFLGVTVGERHERAREREGVRAVFHKGAPGSKVQKGAGARVSGKSEIKKKRSTKTSAGTAKSSGIKKTLSQASRASRRTLEKGYYVQVGAFKDKTWAYKWCARAKAKGYRALVLHSKARGVYRVVVGPYPSREGAVKTARKVDKIFKVRSSVVPDSRLR